MKREGTNSEERFELRETMGGTVHEECIDVDASEWADRGVERWDGRGEGCRNSSTAPTDLSSLSSSAELTVSPANPQACTCELSKPCEPTRAEGMQGDERIMSALARPLVASLPGHWPAARHPHLHLAGVIEGALNPPNCT